MSSLSNLSPDEPNSLADICAMSGDSPGVKESAEKENLKFYAVSFPDALSSDIAAQCLIFTSKKEALEAIKKYTGARFKQFSSYDEAVEYSSKPLPNLEVQASFAEEKSNFKSISSQEKVSLRKTIERGDGLSFLDKVWSNPRHLINCNDDGPTPLQEGTRYNALHVAAKFKKTNMCLIILNTLHDIGFISGLYPKENPPKLRERIKRLVDLYLNSPEKSLSETPLHFACKFGADGVLSILLSFPECDVNKRNKYGVLAREMVCDRVAASPGLKEKMLLMFEDLFYIPVLRDVANNILEPVIGEPCRSNIVLQATSGSFSCSEQKKTLRYCAFAGPMSQSSADKFYTVFSKKKFEEHLSYTPEQKKKLVDICRSDSEKGLERVGRKLAKTFDTSWIEFWPKLDFWGDMSTCEGLEFLENHFKSQHENADVSLSVLDLKARCDNFTNLISNFVEEFVRKLPQFLNNKNKITFFVLFQSLLPYTFCMNKFSFSDEDQLFLIHHEIGHLLYLKLIENSSESFEAIKLYINTQFINMYNFINNSPFKEHNQWKMFLCILKYACYCQSSNILVSKPPSCDCNWIIEKSSYSYSSSMCYFSILKLKQSYSFHRARNNLCESEKINGVCTVSSDSLNTKEQSPQSLENDLKFDAKSEGCEIEQEIFEVAEETFSEYCDITNVFVTTVDKFCLAFSSTILELSDRVPFTSTETFFTAFKKIMPLFKPLCEFNFSKNCVPNFYHHEIALTILEKIGNASFDILAKWKNYFVNTDILHCKSCDLHKFGVANMREWIHLLCVMRHVFIVNFHLLKPDETEIEREPCKCYKCKFGLDGKLLSIDPHHCLNWLKLLRNKYKLNVLDVAPLHLLSLSSDEEEEENGEAFYTPPESPLPFEREIFIAGSDFTDIDIDVLRAIVDDGISISRVKYPNVHYWKTLMESKLGSLLNPKDKLSCTPASSSASVRRAVTPSQRAVTPMQRARRTLF